MRSKIVVATMLLTIGCGGDSTHVDGTITGTRFVAKEALSATVTQTFGDRTVSWAAIAISPESGICGTLGAGGVPKSTRLLLLSLADLDEAGVAHAPATAGTYTIVAQQTETPPPHPASAVWMSLDGACQAAAPAPSRSGSVVLSNVANGSYDGSLELTFDNGDRITGQFSTTNCATLTDFVGNMNPSCSP
jgi:hypothetical protein